MSDTPRRPILRLKSPPPIIAPEPVAAPAAAPEVPAGPRWKCKPCGSVVEVAADLEPTDSVRCPNCGARLGLAADFLSDPPNTAKLRARRVGG